MPAGAGVRRAYLDNLKIVLVAGVILGHAFITYGDIGSWAYREPSTNAVFNGVAAVVVSLGSLFAMGLFFLIAGLLTPGPLLRKGAPGFLRDRALRLGIPFLAYLLLIYPLVQWAGSAASGDVGYLLENMGELDPGPLWFVGVLLLFTVTYTAWRRVRPASTQPRPLQGRFLVLLALAIAAGSLLVRLQFPINSSQLLASHVWQWPQCIALFVLGLLSAERGWLQPVPGPLRRAWGWAAASATLVILAAMATAESVDPFAGGLTWQAALTAGCEGIIAVGFSVSLLGLFQRHFDRAGRFAKAMGRAAFGAYVLQAPVLVTLALLARTVPAAPDVKFLIVAPGAVAGSFALSWLLTRVPGIGRIL